VVIERVTKEDASELLEIYGPYVTETAISFEYEIPSVEEFEKRIEDISCKYPYIKAIVDGRIAGYAYATAFKGRKAYDWSVETTIYLRPEYRRRGIGTTLYKQLEKSLVAMGILNMNACIASPKENSNYLTDDSEKFHTSIGFERVGCFHNSGFKFDRWFDMIWMEKMIGDHIDSPKQVDFGKWEL